MIVTDARTGTKVTGDFKVKSFSIDINAKAFDILLNSIYSDKISAIIRESTSNAYDSHVKKGQSKPFYVHFPTSLDPRFYVRDYGTGMTPEQVDNVYTHLFLSDKTDSNDYVGGWGIGAKCFYSYTRSFSITSYINGIKYPYICFISDDGIPQIASQGEFETDEEDGVLVELNVKNKDFYDFNTRRQLLRFYDNIESNVNIDKPKFTLEGEVEGYRYGLSDECSIVMGNVPFKFSNDIKVVLFANIGDVDVSTSREDLQYTDKTRSFIKRITSLIKLDVLKRIDEQCNAQNCDFNKNLMKSRLLRKINIYHGVKTPDKSDKKIRIFSKRNFTFVGKDGLDMFVENNLNKGAIVRCESLNVNCYLFDPKDRDYVKSEYGITDEVITLASEIPYNKEIIRTKTETEYNKAEVLIFDQLNYEKPSYAWKEPKNEEFTYYCYVKRFHPYSDKECKKPLSLVRLKCVAKLTGKNICGIKSGDPDPSWVNVTDYKPDDELVQLVKYRFDGHYAKTFLERFPEYKKYTDKTLNEKATYLRIIGVDVEKLYNREKLTFTHVPDFLTDDLKEQILLQIKEKVDACND